jgi:nucleotide-binding universal stress UspA family protein
MSRPTPTGTDGQSAVRRILVATDFSDGSGAALNRARQLASLHDAALTLVHVVPEDGGDDLRGIAERGLLRLAAHFGASESDTVVAAGSTSAAIAATAETIGADLVVVGAHGAHWLQDLFVGSTAESVVDAGKVPVLLVRTPGDDPYRLVLIAVDLTERAEPTARGAIAVTPDSRHLLVHVATVVGDAPADRLTAAAEACPTRALTHPIDLVVHNFVYLGGGDE